MKRWKRNALRDSSINGNWLISHVRTKQVLDLGVHSPSGFSLLSDSGEEKKYTITVLYIAHSDQRCKIACCTCTGRSAFF